MIHMNSDISWLVNVLPESDKLDDDADCDSDYFDDGYDAPDIEAFDTDALFIYWWDDDFDY